jgi:PPOX class probable F420-dependent enzyme
MAAVLEGRPREILEAPNYVVLSIPREDGSVQSVVVWAHLDDDHVTLNSAIGRGWPANLQRTKKATVLAMADSNPYEWVAVEGELVEASTEGADDHIDQLAKKYLDADSYPYRNEAEQRISFWLRPTRIRYNAPMG